MRLGEESHFNLNTLLTYQTVLLYWKSLLVSIIIPLPHNSSEAIRDPIFSLPKPILIPELRISADNKYQSNTAVLFFPDLKYV